MAGTSLPRRRLWFVTRGSPHKTARSTPHHSLSYGRTPNLPRARTWFSPACGHLRVPIKPRSLLLDCQRTTQHLSPAHRASAAHTPDRSVATPAALFFVPAILPVPGRLQACARAPRGAQHATTSTDFNAGRRRHSPALPSWQVTITGCYHFWCALSRTCLQARSLRGRRTAPGYRLTRIRRWAVPSMPPALYMVQVWRRLPVHRLRAAAAASDGGSAV